MASESSIQGSRPMPPSSARPSRRKQPKNRYLSAKERLKNRSEVGGGFFRPFGAGHGIGWLPTPCGVGCVLSPLRGFWSVEFQTVSGMPQPARLIPDVVFVVGDVVLLEECDEFFLEGLLLMMFLLFCNVFCHLGEVGFTHAEDAVSGLPSEFWIPFFMHPARGVRLQHARDFGGRVPRPDAQQRVNVVRGAVDDQCRSPHFADDAAKVGE